MKIVAVIPARWHSTRFPGKPLAKIAGKEMILRVWERVVRSSLIDDTFVATDSKVIQNFCAANAIKTVMTNESHATGSDRLAEVAEKVEADIYVNIQGDEPLIDPSSIDAVSNCLLAAVKKGINVATGYIEVADDEQLNDSSVVHLLPALDDTVISFSRFPIPYPMGEPMDRTVHVGLYAFTRQALIDYSTWERGPAEKAESIEVLRFLEHGQKIACVRVKPGSIGVDLPSDIARVEEILGKEELL
ncbi:MAG: 3-deoxy-manno-octulosonate cytidylyltransferase [Pseudomonadota bacterium]|nr:3-deoxy-manno-octulosonate cytidylyltransferase [Pseudomonadota bacterium]